MIKVEFEHLFESLDRMVVVVVLGNQMQVVVVECSEVDPHSLAYVFALLVGYVVYKSSDSGLNFDLLFHLI